MKMHTQFLGALAVCVCLSVTGTASAFAPIHHPSTREFSFSSTTKLASSSPTEAPLEIFPVHPRLEPIQGGGTVRTYQMPPWADRVQYSIKTNGRPLKCTVQLWLGPLRNVHTLELDQMDGNLSPVQATIKFKQQAPQLKISTSDDLQLPILAAVQVPSPDQAKGLAKNTESVWKNATPDQKLVIQGGCTTGGGGAVRSWSIPDEVESIQLLAWSKDVGKKSLKCNVELLQGPNNFKQKFFLQCGGGSQPYHMVLQTPGEGWVVRITNKKFVEDGKVQIAIVPYQTADGNPAHVQAGPGQSAMQTGSPTHWSQQTLQAQRSNPYGAPWWEKK